MTTGQISPQTQHPTARLVAGLRDVLAEHEGAAIWTMSPTDLGELLPQMAVVINQLESITLTMLREADRHQIGDPVGHANTAGWWATTTRSTKPAAHKAVALAADLDRDEHTATATAMATGAVSVEQAAVILKAVDALPADLVDPALRRNVETHLIGLAAHHDPRELRILGRRVLDVIAPEIGEAVEQKILEDEERHALATARFEMNPDGHGSMIGRFKIPALAGEMLATHLRAIAAPRHRAALDTEATPRTVARPLRLGQAFVEYIESRAKTGMPKAGGIPATVVVTMTIDNLLTGNGAAVLGSGEKISAAEARRLICESNAYSAFLGTRSTDLDLGRKTRFHTETQRIAIGLRDGGCAAEHCDWPPSMCHIHHLDQWALGGVTNYERGIMLCPHHHTLAHDRRYQLKASANGKVLFTRRT